MGRVLSNDWVARRVSSKAARMVVALPVLIPLIFLSWSRVMSRSLVSLCLRRMLLAMSRADCPALPVRRRMARSSRSVRLAEPRSSNFSRGRRCVGRDLMLGITASLADCLIHGFIAFLSFSQSFFGDSLLYLDMIALLVRVFLPDICDILFQLFRWLLYDLLPQH